VAPQLSPCTLSARRSTEDNAPRIDWLSLLGRIVLSATSGYLRGPGAATRVAALQRTPLRDRNGRGPPRTPSVVGRVLSSRRVCLGHPAATDPRAIHPGSSGVQSAPHASRSGWVRPDFCVPITSVDSARYLWRSGRGSIESRSWLKPVAPGDATVPRSTKRVPVGVGP
jgi:hypothetical protein